MANRGTQRAARFLIDDLLEHFPMRDIWTFMIKCGISIIPGIIWV